MDTFRNAPLVKAILVSVVASISVPILGSFAFSIILAPIVWLYGFAAAILLFPMSFLLTLPAAVWFGIRTLLAKGFGRAEAVVAVVVSVTATAFVLNPDSILGLNALPTIQGDGRLIGRLTIWLVGVAFASIGAVATHLILAKTSLISRASRYSAET